MGIWNTAANVTAKDRELWRSSIWGGAHSYLGVAYEKCKAEMEGEVALRCVLYSEEWSSEKWTKGRAVGGRVAEAMAWSFFKVSEEPEFLCSTKVGAFVMGLSSY